jgi:hypothetical protein
MLPFTIDPIGSRNAPKRRGEISPILKSGCTVSDAFFINVVLPESWVNEYVYKKQTDELLYHTLIHSEIMENQNRRF